MKQLHTKEKIEDMRKRLYDRGPIVDDSTRHELSDAPVEVSGDWSSSSDIDEIDGDEVPVKKHAYRTFVIVVSLLIFIFVAGISTLFLYIGGNQISNDNIQVSVQGPSTADGGEVTQFQVAVSNHNTVEIESVTLILKYPQGTRSVEDSPRNLFEERILIDDINTGEVRNIPIQVALFGEENTEKIIEATVEYRVSGSNSMFYKEADPLRLRISSSQLVLRAENLEKVSSGQLVDVVLTAVSNASVPLRDILVTASYPNGFSFESSSPNPAYGQNVWRIDELLPEGSTSIKLKGIVTGLMEETFRINFEVGPSNPNNPYLVGATLAEAGADFIIERPFIDVAVLINNEEGDNVILTEGDKASVNIKITNTIDVAVYDLTVEVVTKGNALDENSINSSSGFYDSNDGTVRWEVANNASFDRVLPGDSRTLIFGVVPGPNLTTSSFDMVVNVYARRVDESSAQETLVGSVQSKVKYSSNVEVDSQVGRNVGRFVDIGPIPPKVGEVTTYSLTLVAAAGANDMANTIVETSLPLYVDWLDDYDTDGVVTYNSVSKTLKWDIGAISSGQRKDFTFQVGIKPSVSQLNRPMVLLNTQNIRANDKFTSALLQDSAEAVTTELSTEMGFPEDNGNVQR
ncbi:MAG: hypothetical protein ACI9BF_000775 [Candidatus Paceibacteria bacterium]|jgi:hypothetical protein